MSGDKETFIVVEDGLPSVAVRYYETFHYEAREAAAACSEISEKWSVHAFSDDISYALRIGMAELPPKSDEKRNIKMFYFMTPIFAKGSKPLKEDIDSLYNLVTQKALAVMKSMAKASDCDISAAILNPPAEMLSSLDEFLGSVH